MKTLTGLFGSSLDGCLLSNSPPHALRQSLDLIMMGESVFPFSLLMSSFPAEADPISAEPTIVNESFSMRELQVLAILQNGKSNKTIAREVGLSEATIKVHIKNVLRKLGASNRTEAAIWMMKHQNLLQDTEYLPALPERDHHSMADVLAHEDF
jgi:two-component system nitrate/nitrite response regulator NarL